MTRPEHVRCENCCYWERLTRSWEIGFGVREAEDLPPEDDANSPYGECRRYPESSHQAGRAYAITFNNDACGEFRAEWPDDPKKPLRLPELATCCECGLRFVKETMLEVEGVGSLVCQECAKPDEVVDLSRPLCSRCQRPYRSGDPWQHPGEDCPKGWDCQVCGESGLWSEEKCKCS